MTVGDADRAIASQSVNLTRWPIQPGQSDWEMLRESGLTLQFAIPALKLISNFFSGLLDSCRPGKEKLIYF